MGLGRQQAGAGQPFGEVTRAGQPPDLHVCARSQLESAVAQLDRRIAEQGKLRGAQAAARDPYASEAAVRGGMQSERSRTPVDGAVTRGKGGHLPDTTCPVRPVVAP
ncbi:hypothetical protein GCM10009765_52180 [Fodinicola feengrottensis]|uniref:Uncharacterized protein n=1 Tax=Fodinicola feengrottensis TaxID=435914 RepID=A0ABP4U2Y4_9ACTN